MLFNNKTQSLGPFTNYVLLVGGKGGHTKACYSITFPHISTCRGGGGLKIFFLACAICEWPLSLMWRTTAFYLIIRWSCVTFHCCWDGDIFNFFNCLIGRKSNNNATLCNKNCLYRTVPFIWFVEEFLYVNCVNYVNSLVMVRAYFGKLLLIDVERYSDKKKIILLYAFKMPRFSNFN